MKLHEYQAKQLLAAYGIAIPRGVVAKTPPGAGTAYEALKRQCAEASSAFTCQLKAQLHSGGRGKAGGVVSVSSPQEATASAQKLLGKRLVTAQTGSGGLPVTAVLLEEQVAVAQERYLALTVYRFRASPLVLASQRGGMDIEQVAATEPQAITHQLFDAGDGPTAAQVEVVAKTLQFTGPLAVECSKVIRALWKFYSERDASLVEINPLVVTKEGKLLTLDAKVILDDNASFRHADRSALRDEEQEHPLELKASRIGISYVGLEGNIGCLVNGAGLAMATNDMIKIAGGSPANFLDVGGGANVEQVTHAFSIILAEPRVKVIFVNIFGGIMRCDWIAQGLLNATQKLDVRVPIVVRLQGTNVEEGRKLLKEAKRLSLISLEGFAEAARRAVELAR